VRRVEGVGAALAKGNTSDDLREVKGLVKRWSWLHLVRSMLPLAGTVLGVVGTFAGM
jgi:hypothetical protein